jgi:hypothetical protein
MISVGTWMAARTSRTSTAWTSRSMRSRELGLTAIRSQRDIRWRARTESAAAGLNHSSDAPVPHPCRASRSRPASMAADCCPHG